MMYKASITKHSIAMLALVACTHAHPTRAQCPRLAGDFDIDVQDLYAESAAWDPKTCRLYLSSTYNLSLVSFDLHMKTSKAIDIAGLTNTGSFNFTEYHLNGVDYDESSGDIYVAAGAATAFTSTDTGDYSTANYTGPNLVLRYSPADGRFDQITLEPVQEAYLSLTRERTSGFQDMAEHKAGTLYAVGSFGDSTARIPKGSNSASLWYHPPQYNKTWGFGGIFSVGDTLVVSDRLTGSLYTFDAIKAVPEARHVPLQSLPSDYRPLSADGLFAPSKYHGKVALWSDDYNGTSVYGSVDSWTTAHFPGLIPNEPEAVEQGGLAVATLEIGESLYNLNEFFQFDLPVRPRKAFTMYDITAQVDHFVQTSSLPLERPHGGWWR